MGKALGDAEQGDVFRHERTGAEVVIVQRSAFVDEFQTVQLNQAEGHGPGWVADLRDDAKGWAYVRTEGP